MSKNTNHETLLVKIGTYWATKASNLCATLALKAEEEGLEGTAELYRKDAAEASKAAEWLQAHSAE